MKYKIKRLVCFLVIFGIIFCSIAILSRCDVNTSLPDKDTDTNVTEPSDTELPDTEEPDTEDTTPEEPKNVVPVVDGVISANEYSVIRTATVTDTATDSGYIYGDNTICTIDDPVKYNAYGASFYLSIVDDYLYIAAVINTTDSSQLARFGIANSESVAQYSCVDILPSGSQKPQPDVKWTFSETASSAINIGGNRVCVYEGKAALDQFGSDLSKIYIWTRVYSRGNGCFQYKDSIDVPSKDDTIVFKLFGGVCTADVGATWSEWLEDIDVIDYVIDNDHVYIAFQGVYYALELDGSYIKGTDLIVKNGKYDLDMSKTLNNSNSSNEPVQTTISFTTPLGSKTTTSGTTFQDYYEQQHFSTAPYLIYIDHNGYVYEYARGSTSEVFYLSYNGSKVKGTDTIISGATYQVYSDVITFTTPGADRTRTAFVGDSFVDYIGTKHIGGQNTEAGSSVLKSDSEGYVFEVKSYMWAPGDGVPIEVSYIGLNGEKVKATDRIISGANYVYVETKSILG